MPGRYLSLAQTKHDWHAERRSASASLAEAGRFNRTAIMRKAVQVARSLQAGGASWQWRMAIALRHVWRLARTAMDAAKAALPVPASTWQPPTRLDRRPSGRPAFVRGSRAFSHGW